MKEKEQRFSEVISCGHCGNVSVMKVEGEYSQVKSYFSEGTGWEDGYYYELLCCPSCERVTLRRCRWHDGMDPDDVVFQTLYPAERSREPRGLPERIGKAYEAALKVREIDANAYGVLAGRLLELVCDDRGASGDNIDKKLANLVSKGEIPDKLAEVAKNLRNLRDVGAHATLGDLTPREVPILSDLVRALLEYVYGTPALVEDARERLRKLKAARKKNKPKT
jgi:hypothetical protein